MPPSIDPQHLEQLLNQCFRFARMMLEKHGEFHSFGAIINTAGQLTPVAAPTGEAQPPAADLYRLLFESIRAQYLRGEILAAAITANVTIPPAFQPTYPEGIRVLLETRDYARHIYLPYQISDSTIQYGELIPVLEDPTIFAAPPPP